MAKDDHKSIDSRLDGNRSTSSVRECEIKITETGTLDRINRIIQNSVAGDQDTVGQRLWNFNRRQRREQRGGWKSRNQKSEVGGQGERNCSGKGQG